MTTNLVLIVDDDESLRELLRLTLPTEGYEIVEATDAPSALELARARRPDLVLLDWRMPGGGGGVVLEALKREHPSLPVVVLTAESEDPTRHEARKLGVDVFLAKPFSPLQLLGVVERLLAERPIDKPA